MKKVVLNKCYGEFSLSEEAYKFLGIEWDGFGFAYMSEEERANEKLVECVEALGEKANGEYADLVVVEIPDDLEYKIDDYDGVEMLYEKNRRW